MAKLFENRSDDDRERERQREINSLKSNISGSHSSNFRIKISQLKSCSPAAASSSITRPVISTAHPNTDSNDSNSIFTLPVSGIRVLYVLLLVINLNFVKSTFLPSAVNLIIIYVVIPKMRSFAVFYLRKPKVPKEFLTDGLKGRTYVPIPAIRERIAGGSKKSALDSIDWITIGVITSSVKKVSSKASFVSFLNYDAVYCNVYFYISLGNSVRCLEVERFA